MTRVPFTRFPQQFLNDVVVVLVPIPGLLERPVVDDIADQIERIRLGIFQKVQQHPRLRTPRANVEIGDPDGAVAGRQAEVGGHRRITSWWVG